MVIPSLQPYRKHPRPVRKKPVFAPPAVALTLVAASIDEDVNFVLLQFDRAIDVSSMDVSAIQVGSIITDGLYQGDELAIPVDATTVQVPLTAIGVYSETNVELFATAASGIVAVDDGGAWAGTGGTGLPYP